MAEYIQINRTRELECVIADLTRECREARESIEALTLALETERDAANLYAKQVAHWIGKHDAANADAAQMREALEKALAALELPSMKTERMLIQRDAAIDAARAALEGK